MISPILRAMLVPVSIAMLISPGSGEEARDDPVAALRAKDPDARRAAILRLVQNPDRRSSALIARRLRDSAPEVRLAAARALGEIGNGRAVRALVDSLRRSRDEPSLVVAISEALAETGSTSAVDALVALARTEMSRSKAISTAAISALGRIRDKKCVTALIQLLGSATPVYTRRTSSFGHSELIGPIRNSLRALTGQKLRTYASWSRWWRRVRRYYRLPEDPKAALEAMSFTDDGFGFRIERPSRERWAFRRPAGVLLEARFQGSKDDAVFATVVVRAHDVRAFGPATVKAYAEQEATQIQGLFKDIKEQNEGSRARLAGRDAVGQRFVGLTLRGLAVELRQWVVRHGDFLFTVRIVVSTGASQGVQRDLDKIVKSVRFHDV